MKKPDIPADEECRLKALRSCEILGTASEERFDRITRLAKRMFNVPITIVSLIDEDRQWFKSCIGLEVRETSRDISFCGHAILGDGVFIVPDATKDERFADNPLVLDEPKIRFYAGYPLKFMDGSKLGTLCVIDKVPRDFSEEDIEALKDLAELVEGELVAVLIATTDDLTQILNRRGFMAHAQNSLNMIARMGTAASLVFFDLNDFKKINDTFGHAEGDKALIIFAEKLRDTFRESDVIARLGGDEFVVLLTNTTSKSAEQVIDKFKKVIEDDNHKNNKGYEISFSIGIVSVDSDQDYSLGQLLNRADKIMYEQKSYRTHQD